MTTTKIVVISEIYKRNSYQGSKYRRQKKEREGKCHLTLTYMYVYLVFDVGSTRKKPSVETTSL